MCIYPPTTYRDVRKMKWQFNVSDAPEKRLPAIAYRPVRETVKKFQDGMA